MRLCRDSIARIMRIPLSPHDTVPTAILRFVLELVALFAIGAAFGVEAKLVHIASETLAACNPDLMGELIGDKSNSVMFDNSKIKRAVPDYVATTRFDQGIRRTIAHIYSHPELQEPDPEFDAWTDALVERYEALVRELPKL